MSDNHREGFPPTEAAGQAAHTATPTAATPANAETTEAALSARSHPKTANTTASTATTTAVPNRTHRCTVTPTLSALVTRNPRQTSERIPIGNPPRSPRKEDRPDDEKKASEKEATVRLRL
ncbi:hypothetical protein GCM10010116_61650 [Microbispora rosea subsp. aerata]|nr:hypothetical protein GCM10010116_61650 [Microbispora rosea subsp. aerata]GIH59135.1 hypothetical protein Mro02_60490 [Microbispora rosea subsp. aerata]GLJ87112.1 hypothetical protein GCM10017588_58560 [Microbispora rosea subsp. aerata]